MRLVLHIGLHKTASTAFQTMCGENAQRLCSASVFWRKKEGYPAHHDEAWSLLRDETGVVADYVAEARAEGCRTAILSSEELDYVLHVPQKARAIEAQALAAGVTDIVWAMALRRPSEAFRSHVSELTKHGIHLDPLQGFLEIMRSGGLHFTGRHDGGSQFWNWFFTFDYARYVTRLRDAVSGQVLAYDYHSEGRLPGLPVLRAAAPGDDALLADLSAPGRVNARLSDEVIRENLTNMLLRHGMTFEDVATVLAAQSGSTSPAADAVLDAHLDARFGDYHHLLGYGPAAQPMLEEA